MKKIRCPYVRQHDQNDCGAACLAMIAEYYGQKMSLGKYRELIKTDASGTTIYGIVKGAEEIGLKASALSGNYSELVEECKKKEIRFPFIAHVITEEGYTHFIVVYAIKNNMLKVGDPAKDIMSIPVDMFLEMWTETIITFELTENFQKGNYKKNSIKRYLDIIQEQKKYIVVIVLLSLLIAVINMIGTSLFEYIVDGVYDEQKAIKMNGLMHFFYQSLPLGGVCVSVICLYIVQATMQYLRDITSLNITKKISMPVALNYYTKLTKLPLDFYAGRKTGDLMTRFDDALSVCQILVNMIFTVIIDGFLAVFYAVYMASINLLLFVITGVILVLYSLIVLFFKNTVKKLQILAMSRDANLNSYLKETIQGMETIKSFEIERTVRRKTLELAKGCMKSDYSIGKVSSLQENLIHGITSVGIVMLLWIGATLCGSGTITTGELIAFYAIMGCFLMPMQNIISLQTQFQSAIVAAERLNDIMDLNVEGDIGSNVQDTDFKCEDIVVDKITFRYGTRNAVLNECSLEIKAKSYVALVGESGSGKSTLAKLLVGFYEPEAGTISVSGKKYSDISKAVLRRKITYITQDTFLFSDSIKNNLFLDEQTMLNMKENELLNNFELLRQLPYGLDTMVEENGQNLSGGQKQQVAFMRAILRDTEVLILDETTSNLDSFTEKMIREKIKQLCRNITVIMITHRLSSVAECDQIYYMSDGKIDDQGTHEELLKKNPKYQQLWKSFIN